MLMPPFIFIAYSLNLADIYVVFICYQLVKPEILLQNVLLHKPNTWKQSIVVI